MTLSFLLLSADVVGNIFVDPSTIPGWLRTVIGLNPVTHLTDATRGLTHGGGVLPDVAWVRVTSAVVAVRLVRPVFRSDRT